MIFRRLLQSIGCRVNTMANGKRKTDFIENTLDALVNAKKRRKCVFDECEIVIDVNRKGYCTFSVVSGGGSGNDDNSGNNNDDNNNTTLWSSRFWKLEYDKHGVKYRDSAFSKKYLESQFPPTSDYVALDCEFVGLGEKGRRSAIGRCSIVDYEGNVLLDIYARPDEPVTDYRTQWSGITPAHMARAVPLEFALVKIAKTIQGKIVVGHGIFNDFAVLGFHPTRENIRDTLKYKYAVDVNGKRSLKALAHDFLGIHIQQGAHCSIVDAQAVMKLYRIFRHDWETDIFLKAFYLSKNVDSGNDDDDGSKNDSTSGFDPDKSSPNNTSNQKPEDGDMGTNGKPTKSVCGRKNRTSEAVKVSSIQYFQNTDSGASGNQGDCVMDKVMATMDCNELNSSKSILTEEKCTIWKGNETRLNVKSEKYMEKCKSDSNLLNLGNKKSTNKRNNGRNSCFGQINVENISAEGRVRSKKAKCENPNISGKTSLIKIVKNSIQEKKTDLNNDTDIENSTSGHSCSDEDTSSLFISSSTHLFDDKFWPEFNE